MLPDGPPTLDTESVSLRIPKSGWGHTNKNIAAAPRPREWSQKQRVAQASAVQAQTAAGDPNIITPAKQLKPFKKKVAVLDSFIVITVGKRAPASRELPAAEQIESVDLPGHDFEKVDSNGLEQFTRLKQLNLSDNRLGLEYVAEFPALVDLSLSCNCINTLKVPENAFPCLQKLDLSFNTIDAQAILPLASLPALRVLILDHNELCPLPPRLDFLEHIEELSITDNKLDESCLQPLSTVPNLNVAHNLIGTIPPVTFARLRLINISNNLLGLSQDIENLNTQPSMETVIANDNPITIAEAKAVVAPKTSPQIAAKKELASSKPKPKLSLTGGSSGVFLTAVDIEGTMPEEETQSVNDVQVNYDNDWVPVDLLDTNSKMTKTPKSLKEDITNLKAVLRSSLATDALIPKS